ncbi:50S ribosomal protein L18e [Candidatus Woesearchaeota archaeon]|nr:50S ribosomal protein L18e [Candidatus Woesearchaeota archaeon]
MKTGPTNPQLNALIQELKKSAIEQDVAIWKRVATDLEKPTRNRRAVNLSRINLHARNDEIVVVPGKVLSSGEIKQGLTIAAYQFSKGALEKIQQAKSQAITLNELIRKNPKGKRMRIIG